MAKKDRKIVAKEPFGGNMGKRVRYDDGSEAVFLNPHGKGRKFATELKENVRLTNDMRTVKQEGLTPTQAAFRSGYLSAQKDSARIYKKKNGLR